MTKQNIAIVAIFITLLSLAIWHSNITLKHQIALSDCVYAKTIAEGHYQPGSQDAWKVYSKSCERQVKE
jgi:hypothetical protein